MIVALISPDDNVRVRLQQALETDGDFEAVWSLAEYPDRNALDCCIDRLDGCVIVLDFSRVDQARHVASILGGHPHLRLVAANALAHNGGLAAAAQCGIQDVLGSSFSREELCGAIRRAKLGLGTQGPAPGGEINAFLPARPGAGATTVALNTAASIATRGGASTVFLDFDLKLGISSFLLKLHSERSLEDALRHVRYLDEALWEKMVSERGALHLLGSAPTTFREPVPWAAFELLLRFAQKRYASLCVDLPGTMEEYEMLTLGRAHRILLICVADISGLHMARRKLEQLDEMGLAGKVMVVVNQAGRRHAFAPADAEKVLNHGVSFILPQDDGGISEAVRLGDFVRSNSSFGREVQVVARALANNDASAASPRKLRKFIDFFSVTPARMNQSR